MPTCPPTSVGRFHPHPKLSGHRYLIVFVCRSSGYTHTYFLKKKSDAPDVLNEFLDDLKQSGHRPEHITIKSDAESVYIHGLFQQRTVPRTWHHLYLLTSA